MDLKRPLDDLLAKEMDRKQFLAHLGGGFLALIGITSLIKALTSHGKRESGYGSGPYGGKQ